MSETCDTVPVARDRVAGPFYQLDLFVSKEACVTLTIEGYDTTEALAFARFTNTGDVPVTLATTSLGSLKFVSVWDAFAPEAPVEMPGGPPPDPATVEPRLVTVAPGQAVDSLPVSAFLSLPGPDIVEGTTLAGAPLLMEAQSPRSFGLGFRFIVQAQGDGISQVVDHPLTGEITVMLNRTAIDAQ
ncbi:MAG: hypothetical protein AAFQ33_17935 [Pseudomonadota bacterium]